MWKYFLFKEQLKEADKATIRRGRVQCTNANELNPLEKEKRKAKAEMLDSFSCLLSKCNSSKLSDFSDLKKPLPKKDLELKPHHSTVIYSFNFWGGYFHLFNRNRPRKNN